jgi:MmyB-like transcription regulator ligand binding domain
MHSPFGELTFISTTTIFGSPLDVTLQEIALETFFPSDAFTMQALRALANLSAA